MLKFCVALCFSLVMFMSLGQIGIQLHISNDSIKLLDKSITKQHNDSVSVVAYLKKLRSNAVKKGYLIASFDTIIWKGQNCHADFYLGPKTSFIILKADSINKRWLPAKGLTAKLTPFELASFMNKTEQYLLNTGYPFGRVKLSLVHYIQDTIVANLDVSPGREYKVSKIHIKGDSSVSEILISSLTGIRVGDRFEEDKFQAISQKIAQVSFLKEIKQHELLFTDDGCELFVYVTSNPVSSANGTIGLQPNTNGKVGLAGELNLKLLNILKRGEQLHLAWRSIQDQTQSMNLKGNYPFLFKTSFGLDGQMQLYKKDSSFLEVKSTFGIQYLLSSGSYLKAFYQQNSNNLLRGAANNPNFDNLSNVRSNSYGLSWAKRQFDYIPNPSKGIALLFDGLVGTRESKDTDSSQTEKSQTYRFTFSAEWFLSLARRHVLRLASSNEFYYAPEIFQNELFRFGGQLSLRGFNEDELFASSRSVSTLEYRFLLDKNSNIFAFYDQGFYENNSSKYLRDYPFGFGAGFSFGTNLGIFSISYALGKQLNNPVLLSNGKIHFGYIAYF